MSFLQFGFKNLKGKLDLFDYKLLIFIMMMSQDRIIIKLSALVFIFIFHFNFKFGLRKGRLPLFYILIIGVELLKYLFMRQLYLGNWATLLVSSLYWGMAFLSLHQIKLSVENNEAEKSQNTIIAFTVINFLMCVSQLIHVMIVTKSINPYAVDLFAPDIRFPGVIFPYGQSSGDQIRGIFYDNHHNAIISQMCFMFFLFKRKYMYAFFNFFVITIICFNLVTLSTVLSCAILFFVLRGARPKYFISVLALCIVVFYIFITPENIGYLKSRLANSVSSTVNNKDGWIIKKQNAVNKNSLGVDTSLTTFVMDSSYNFDKVSGKKIAYRQTFQFLNSNPVYLLLGSGAGMFSSKLANNFSGVFYGPTILNKNLPAPSYKVFKNNHGYLNKYLQQLEIGKHSINNFPNSVYDQLLSEYGLIGLLLFALYYVFYFVKRNKQLSYGLILIPLLLIGFNYGYYLESLDMTLFFEFLMFLNMREKANS